MGVYLLYTIANHRILSFSSVDSKDVTSLLANHVFRVLVRQFFRSPAWYRSLACVVRPWIAQLKSGV